MRPAPSARPFGPGHLAAGVLLVAGVTLVHLWLAARFMPERLGAGREPAPQRIAVAFVNELKPAEPPAVPPRVAAGRPPPRPGLRSEAVPAPPAASAPWPDAAPEPAAPAEAAATAGMPAEILAEAPAQASGGETSPSAADPDRVTPPSPAAAAASAPASAVAASGVEPEQAAAAADAASPAAAAASAAAFEWPPSTRLSYRLTGDFRGPVEGQAQVEWLRDGLRYQVHLDVGVGPSFAPLLSRRTSSEGRITPEGLRPERFDEATRVLLREPRRLRIDMGGAQVRLAHGREVPRPEGLQDSASQFVQLTWLFTNRPELLRAGQTLPMPLALPRRVQLWQYEVGETVTLDTPLGPVEAVHVRPQPSVAGEARRGGDLVPEAWFAPSLQYLPVRILIRQGGAAEGGPEGGNFVDLRIERLPQQAAPGR